METRVTDKYATFDAARKQAKVRQADANDAAALEGLIKIAGQAAAGGMF